jgi:hypothetical protein
MLWMLDYEDWSSSHSIDLIHDISNLTYAPPNLFILGPKRHAPCLHSKEHSLNRSICYTFSKSSPVNP